MRLWQASILEGVLYLAGVRKISPSVEYEAGVCMNHVHAVTTRGGPRSFKIPSVESSGVLEHRINNKGTRINTIRFSEFHLFLPMSFAVAVAPDDLGTR